jgi:hypothetical protein
MEIYLLIDNANWKKLIPANGVDRNLKILKYLTSSGQVRLLLPEAMHEAGPNHIIKPDLVHYGGYS